MTNLNEIRGLAGKNERITARLAELGFPLDSVGVVYRVEAPDIGEYEDIVLFTGEAGVSLIYSDVRQAVSLDVHPALLRERQGVS